MVIENQQIKITKEDESKLNEFPLSERDYMHIPLQYKLENIIDIAEKMIEHTKTELVNCFTLEEVKILINMSNNYLYQTNISPKNFLTANIQAEVGVGEKNILDKLYKLTEFQSYIVLKMYYEFFNTPAQSGDYIDILKKVFQITEEVNMNFILQDESTYQIKSYLVNKNIPNFKHTLAISVFDMLVHTKRELINYFTTEEATFILASTMSLLYTGRINPKSCLIMGAEDSIRYEGLDAMYNVDKKIILDKLHKLTEFQSYTVLTMCFQIFSLPTMMGALTEQIRTVFQITEATEEQ